MVPISNSIEFCLEYIRGLIETTVMTILSILSRTWSFVDNALNFSQMPFLRCVFLNFVKNMTLNIIICFHHIITVHDCEHMWSYTMVCLVKELSWHYSDSMQPILGSYDSLRSYMYFPIWSFVLDRLCEKNCSMAKVVFSHTVFAGRLSGDTVKRPYVNMV